MRGLLFARRAWCRCCCAVRRCGCGLKGSGVVYYVMIDGVAEGGPLYMYFMSVYGRGADGRGILLEL
jgi:hypothetical protein